MKSYIRDFIVFKKLRLAQSDNHYYFYTLEKFENFCMNEITRWKDLTYVRLANYFKSRYQGVSIRTLKKDFSIIRNYLKYLIIQKKVIPSELQLDFDIISEYINFYMRRQKKKLLA